MLQKLGGKCYKDSNLTKTEILKLLKYGKCYKNGNLEVTKIRKNVTKTEILKLLKYGKCYDRNFKVY